MTFQLSCDHEASRCTRLPFPITKSQGMVDIGLFQQLSPRSKYIESCANKLLLPQPVGLNHAASKRKVDLRYMPSELVKDDETKQRHCPSLKRDCTATIAVPADSPFPTALCHSFDITSFGGGCVLWGPQRVWHGRCFCGLPRISKLGYGPAAAAGDTHSATE
jgi:hypothetical protein